MIEAKAVKASIYLSGGVIQCRGTVPLTVGQQSVLISAMSTESDTSSVKVAMPSWVKVNDVPALTYATVKGEEIEVHGYTTIDEMMKLAYSPDLPNIKL